MPILRSRRFNKQKAEATQQIITFSLGQEQFALPIQAVQRVVWLGKVYGDPYQTGVSLTLYQGQELLIIDVGHRIFGRRKTANPQRPSQRYLVVVQNAKEELAGLPIDSQPKVQPVPQSSFKPLPQAYVTQGNVRCVSSQMVQLAEDEVFFLLDPEQLTQPRQISRQPQQKSL
jgi:chemotaxis signal transduction protein